MGRSAAPAEAEGPAQNPEVDARRLARREELLDAALAALAAEGPEVTMTRMAAEAGVTKPILYRYFGDRAGLQAAIAARFALGLREELAQARRAGAREGLMAGIDAYLAYLERHPEVYRFLTRRMPTEAARGQAMVAGFVHRVATEVADALAERMRAAGLDPAGADLVGFGITGMVQLAGERWLETGRPTRAEVVQQLAGVLWHGLARYDPSVAGGSATLDSVTERY